ncbi:MAG: hypothetical protein DWQ01_05060 [Planctomycetota bacterium]|nr:MAG: hypothetical protein DWQ01_05060 [Planctomycetota bacterium]
MRSLLLLFVLLASSPGLVAQKSAVPPEYKLFPLDFSAGKGPRGVFWFDDWYSLESVDPEKIWEVRADTYTTQAIRISNDRKVLGTLTATAEIGPFPTRPMLWNLSVRGFAGSLLKFNPDLKVPKSVRFHLISDGGVFAGHRLVQGRPRPYLFSRKGLLRPLYETPWQDWKPLAMSSTALLVGLHREGKKWDGKASLVLYEFHPSQKHRHAILDLEITPRKITKFGWLIGETGMPEDRGGRPVVFGPVLHSRKLRRQEALEELQPLKWSGPRQAELHGINDRRDLAGAVAAGGGWRACLWSGKQWNPRDEEVGAHPQVFDDRLGDSVALDINEQGVVVGIAGKRSESSPYGVQGRAVVGDQGRLYDLNGRVRAKGWVLHSAVDINEQGWIAGQGSFEGKARGFVLKPAR